MTKLITRRNLYIAVLLISLAATLGSLFYSEILGLEPCKLCWYQRIFMYPIVLISAVALYRKTKELAYYVLPLSVIGAFIGAYHYVLQIIAQTQDIYAPCSVTGPSCSGFYVQYLGFITIPFMSMIAFIAISVLLYITLRIDR